MKTSNTAMASMAQTETKAISGPVVCNPKPDSPPTGAVISFADRGKRPKSYEAPALPEAKPWPPAKDLQYALDTFNISIEGMLNSAVREGGWKPSQKLINSVKRAFRHELEELALAKLHEGGQRLHDELVKAVFALLRKCGRKPRASLQKLSTESLCLLFCELYRREYREEDIGDGHDPEATLQAEKRRLRLLTEVGSGTADTWLRDCLCYARDLNYVAGLLEWIKYSCAKEKGAKQTV